MNQVHGATVALVNYIGPNRIVLTDCFGNIYPRNMPCDALITKQKYIGLTVRTADCLPIILRSNYAIGVVHAGREGTLSGILHHACKAFDSLGESIHDAWFGPAICVQCYEIHKETNTHFDLITSNKQQLLAQSPRTRLWHLDASMQCTHCSFGDYYSYRYGDVIKRNYFTIAMN